jgi:hypothetical protein
MVKKINLNTKEQLKHEKMAGESSFVQSIVRSLVVSFVCSFVVSFVRFLNRRTEERGENDAKP